MLISVIIPVYKVESYLRKCVDSILNDLGNDLEVILVDDGSPDACPEICDEYASKDNRVRVIHKKNGGLSSARNAGMDACTGRYVLFVDSDDWLDRGTLALLRETILREQTDIVAYSLKRVDESGEILNHEPIKAETNRVLFPADVANRFNLLSTAYLYVCKKEFLEKNRILFTPGIYHEDEEFFAKIFHYAKSVYFLNNHGYNYLQRGNSIMGARDFEHRKKRVRHRILIIKNLTQIEETEKLSSSFWKWNPIRRRIDFLCVGILSELNSDFDFNFRNEIISELKSNGAFPLHPRFYGFKYLIFSLVLRSNWTLSLWRRAVVIKNS